MKIVQLDIVEPVAIVTMQHDEKRNALSRALLGELAAAIDDAGRLHTRAVILRARSGSVVWSAGHDIGEIPAPGIDPLEWDAPLRQFIRKVEESPMPVIAMIEGTVWGGACELVLACDMVVATPESTFALTPARLGVPYNIGGILNLLNAASSKLAREMVFTAKPIPAVRLAELGLINHLAAAGEIELVTQHIASDIAANAPLAIAVMKEQMRILDGARPVSPEVFERIQSLRKRVYSSRDYREGVQAFNEKRTPEFKGD